MSFGENSREFSTIHVGAKKISMKQIYKTKYNENENGEKYKARLMGIISNMEWIIMLYLQLWQVWPL